MRSLKFRAWDKEEKEMGYFVLGDICAHGAYIYTDSGNGFHVDMPIMQYTGNKDKNGVEIYEGDVLKTYAILASDKIGDDSFNVEVKWSGSSWISNGILGEYQCRISEVIGNKWENPELL